MIKQLLAFIFELFLPTSKTKETNSKAWQSGVTGYGPTHINQRTGEYNFGHKSDDIERFDNK